SLQSLEECVSDLVFELSYLTRKSRLNDVQPLRGAPEVFFFAHGDEIAEVPQLHEDSNTWAVSVSCHQSIGGYDSSTALSKPEGIESRDERRRGRREGGPDACTTEQFMVSIAEPNSRRARSTPLLSDPA